LKQFQKQVRGSGEDGKLETLGQAYEHAMESIKSQKAGFRQLAEQVLMWITCARRPLTALELQHALAVEVGEPQLDEENLPQIEDMVSMCAGLVTMDEESKVIRLVHYTTQEYFERTQKDWFPDAEMDITDTCVTYLSFSSFESGFCGTDHEFMERLQSNRFYDYAARNWGHHAHKAPTLTQRVVDFLETDAEVEASSQVMMSLEGHHYSNFIGYSQEVPRQMTGPHLAAYFGLEEAVKALLMRRRELDAKDSRGRTPLSYAAENGYEAIVKLLLAIEGVDADSKTTGAYNAGRTPLSFAAERGHEAVVKLLLGKGVNIDSKDYSGRTPMSFATLYRQEAVVKVLQLHTKTNTFDTSAASILPDTVLIGIHPLGV
jgi:hypothetical protein